MSAALPGFRPASDLGPSQSREQELEELCSRQAEQIERLQDGIESQPALKGPPAKAQASLRPDEMQKLLQIISDLDSRLKLVELQSEKRIEELEGLTNELQGTVRKQSEQIGLLRDGIVRLQNSLEDQLTGIKLEMALDKQRIKALEVPEHSQPTQKDRADALLLLLAASNGKMLAKDARHRLSISKSLLSQLVRSLRGKVEVRPLHTDRRQHVISLIKPLTIEPG